MRQIFRGADWEAVSEFGRSMSTTLADAASTAFTLFRDDEIDEGVEMFRQMVMSWLSSPYFSRIEVNPPEHEGDPISVRAVFIESFEDGVPIEVATAKSITTAADMLDPLLGWLKQRDRGRDRAKHAYVHERVATSADANSHANEFVFGFDGDDMDEVHVPVVVRVVHVMLNVSSGKSVNVFRVRLPKDERINRRNTEGDE